MTQQFELTKEIYPNQLAKELGDAGLNVGFVERHSDGKGVIIFIDDDKKVKTVLDNHIPNDNLEQSLKPILPTQEAIKQTKIDEIDSIKDITELKEYIKKDKGLI